MSGHRTLAVRLRDAMAMRFAGLQEEPDPMRQCAVAGVCVDGPAIAEWNGTRYVQRERVETVRERCKS